MIKTKIIATLGPSCQSEEQIRELIINGVNVFRINLSHGTFSSKAPLIEAIQRARARLPHDPAILLDTRGPEIRTGKVGDIPVIFRQGQSLEISIHPLLSSPNQIGVNYPGIINDVQKGDRILLDDGNLALVVKGFAKETILTEVLVGGPLSDFKRVSLPGVKINLPPLTDKDITDIRFGIEMGVDFIAASFVRKAEDVLAVREVIDAAGGQQHVISKIENQEAVDNLDEILNLSDGLMVARGDLGVELAPEKVPVIQKQIIQMANQQGKPVITATQMLESMIHNPRPTRAEASDVANAILDGSDAVMLSAETAIGKYPLEAVRFLVRNAEVSEQILPYDTLLTTGSSFSTQTSTNAICYASCAIASDLQADAILTTSQSGYSARMVSRHRPKPPIIALSPDAGTRRQMQLLWGVNPLPVKDSSSVGKLFDNAITSALNNNLLHYGDTIVITAGIPFKVSGSTNMLKIHRVGDVHLRGVGIGTQVVTANVSLIKSDQDLVSFPAGNIMVCQGTDSGMLDAMSRASGVIVEEQGFTCHTVIVGREQGLPVIVGVKRCMEKLSQDQRVTMNCEQGQIYRGRE